MIILITLLLFHVAFEVISEEDRALASKNVVSFTKYVTSSNNKEQIVGQIRYHYNEIDNENQEFCTSILTFGVGTAMSVNDYNYISQSIAFANPTIVVIATDSNHDGIVKSSPTKYATLLNNISDQLKSLIPSCDNGNSTIDGYSESVPIFLGGHSSSGQAALQALQGNLFHFTPGGFFGMDPYDISSDTVNYDNPIYLPTLNWGFTKTTCLVNVDKAAMGAYRLFAPASSSNRKTLGRVLYSIDNDNDSKQIGHCVFTDNGCGVGSIVVCPTIHPPKDNWVYEALAKSVKLFLKAIHKGVPFTKNDFSLNTNVSGKVLLQVNEDD